jgi:hypothetical protein
MNAETQRVHNKMFEMTSALLTLRAAHEAGMEVPDIFPNLFPDIDHRALAIETGTRMLNALGDDGLQFGPGQDAVVSVFEPDNTKQLALLQVVTCYAAFGKHLPRLEMCQHLLDPKVAATQRSMLHVSLRQWRCADCLHEMKEMEITRKDEILADKRCDVCLQEASRFRPYIIPCANMIMVTIHPGECCDELFSYATPNATYTKTPRNAPCPCGSRAKFKYCHGSPRKDYWGMGKSDLN